MHERRFELVDGKHNKFWSITVDDSGFPHFNLVTRYGRNGADGSVFIHAFHSYNAAFVAAGIKIREKLRKGYQKIHPDNGVFYGIYPQRRSRQRRSRHDESLPTSPPTLPQPQQEVTPTTPPVPRMTDHLILTQDAAGIPIPRVRVRISSDSDGEVIVADGMSDRYGRATFLLERGTTYYSWNRKTDYSFAQGDSFTVPIATETVAPTTPPRAIAPIKTRRQIRFDD